MVKVNNRKLLDGVLDAVDLGGEQNVIRRLTVLRALDKYDRLGRDAVSALLGRGRKDESGDYTKGAELNDLQIEQILGFLETASAAPKFSTQSDELAFNRTILASLNALKGVSSAPIFQEGLKELNESAFLVASANYGYDRIRIDPSVVRGLEYYTGPVFEVELTFATDGKDGSPRFGSVGGGGRYDGLVSRFRGEPVPATGFSIGVSRLAAALEHLGKLDSKPGYGPVVVTVFDKDRLADYQNMVAKLRAANFLGELYLGNPKNLGNQLKYADRRNAPCVVIQGSDEKAKGDVTIKDLIVGAELAKLEKAARNICKSKRRRSVRAGSETRRDRRRAARAAWRAART